MDDSSHTQNILFHLTKQIQIIESWIEIPTFDKKNQHLKIRT